MFVLKAVCLIACVTVAYGHGLERIAGGQDATPGQFPFVASIRDQNNVHMCGGAIIGPQHVVTAARCTQVNRNIIFVHAGAHSRVSGTRFAVRRIVRHPQYNPQFMLNDISVLVTTLRIEYNRFVQPIALPQTDTPEGFPAAVAGWGITQVWYRELCELREKHGVLCE